MTSFTLIFRNDEVFRAEEGAAEILAVAKDHLLQGLADDNRELKYTKLPCILIQGSSVLIRELHKRSG